MTSKELARRTGSYETASLTEKRDYAAALARAADLLPDSLCDRNVRQPDGSIIPKVANPGKILMLAETGAMLGIHPMAAITQIHIIDGKPALSAALWAALVREAGHRLRVTVTGEGANLAATAELVRHDDPEFTYRVTWTHADAQRANLLNKDNWKKYERSMLKSRAITEVIREGATEVGMGAAYTPEELNPNLKTDPDGAPIELSEVQTPAAAQPSAPIVDEPETRPAPKEERDWAAEIARLSTSVEARELYKQARAAGALDTKIKSGRKTRTLAEWITEIGKSLSEAEAAAAADETETVAEEIIEATIEPDTEGASDRS